MFVLALAVPALMVVVVGYVIGYAVADSIAGLVGTASTDVSEVVGWTTGLLLLAVVVRVMLKLWRRRRNHQK
ncbi:MAG TPA: hypothetical protein VD834_13575 [Blastococcus sp.]|jgi:hypothetical protein|nr:hypothetical protein [Blastococcus sp.]